MNTGTDTTTFKTATVSQIGGLVDGNVASYLASLASSPSAALQEARAGFAENAKNLDSIGGDASARASALIANIRARKTIADKLGQEALGVEPMPRQAVIISDEERIATAARRAAEKFGTPSASASGTDLARPITPAPAKGADKQIS